MNDKQIIFNGDMVRALLEGRKVQTRRPVAPQPVSHEDAENNSIVWMDGKLCKVKASTSFGARSSGRLNAYPYQPHGKPGDYLWVRETFFNNGDPCHDPDYYLYRADGSFEQLLGEDYQDGRWTPSIHMPRWASRLTLKITDVRVERAQDISEKDAVAEGIIKEPHHWRDPEYPLPPYAYRPSKDSEYRWSCPIQAYENLWNSIYNNWKDNPWVWVIEFEVIHKNIDDMIMELEK